MSVSLDLSSILSPNVSPIWLCLPFCLSICFPSGFVFLLVWFVFVFVFVCLVGLFWFGLFYELSHSLLLHTQVVESFLVSVEGHWTCVLTYVFLRRVSLRLLHLDCRYPRGLLQPARKKKTGFVFLLGWRCCVRLAGVVSLFSQFVFQFVCHLALSPSFVSPFVPHQALSFTLAGVLFPPCWACLRSCLQMCLPIFVSSFVSHLALSFSLAGVLCPPSLDLSPNLSPNICFPSGFVFHLGWDAVSASRLVSLQFHLGWSAVCYC